jgi:hypothetical protein
MDGISSVVELPSGERCQPLRTVLRTSNAPTAQGRGTLWSAGCALRFLSDWCLQSELVSRPGATRLTSDAHGEEHAPPLARDSLRARRIPRRYRGRIRDFPCPRGEGPSVQCQLHRARARRDQRHERVGQRHAPGSRQADRARDYDRLCARNVHESDLRGIQWQGGAKGKDRVATAKGA